MLESSMKFGLLVAAYLAGAIGICLGGPGPVSGTPESIPMLPLHEMEIARGCALVDGLLSQHAAETDPSARAVLLESASQHIRDLVSDPRVASVRAWVLAGNIALLQHDSELGSFAMEALFHLRPDLRADPQDLQVKALLEHVVAADLHSMSPDIRRDRNYIFSLFRDAESGDAKAMYNIAHRYSTGGRGLLKNLRFAATMYRRAADAGHVDSMHNLALMLAQGQGVDKDVPAAVALWRKAAAHGCGASRYNLGRSYELGIGMPADLHEAFGQYSAGADAGNARCMHRLGVFHEEGLGTEKSMDAAGAWYARAAEAGLADAMYSLGSLYRRGLGSDGGLHQAVEWYSKAADAGHAEAMNDLAMLLRLDIEGIGKDERRAYALNLAAAQGGHAGAMVDLGVAYANGSGVAPDAEQAREWFLRAEQSGQASGAVMRRVIEEALIDRPDEVRAGTCSACGGGFHLKQALGGFAYKCKCPECELHGVRVVAHARCQRCLDVFAPPSASAIALTAATARTLLEEYARSSDPGAQADLLARANEVIRPVVCDARVEDAEAWLMAGTIAAAGKDADLAAFAFEAIERLAPEYASDPRQLRIMANLNALGIDARVREIRSARPRRLEMYASIGRDPWQVLEIANGWWAGRDSVRHEASAFRWFSALGEAGFGAAQVNLGVMYLDGQGVEPDVSKANDWWRKAAELRSDGMIYGYNTFGQSNLAESYRLGRGVSQDPAKALALHTQAASWPNGHVSCRALGLMYLVGEGVPKDGAKAVEWFTKAARQGDTTAQFNLGVMYSEGRGVARDETKAIEWFTNAARQGDKDAQDVLRRRGKSW